MKTFLFSALVAVSAMAADTTMEPMVLKSVTQSGDFMPGGPVRTHPTTAMVLEVQSNGCTKAADFEVKVYQAFRGQEVAVIRTKPDTCRGIQRKIDITLTTELLEMSRHGWTSDKEIMTNPIYLVNPVDVIDNTTH